MAQGRPCRDGHRAGHGGDQGQLRHGLVEGRHAQAHGGDCSPSCPGSGNGSTSCGQVRPTPPTSFWPCRSDNPIEAVDASEGAEDAPGGKRAVPGHRSGEDSNAGWRSAKRLLPADVHVGKSVNNRLVVTSEDVGIFCALLEFVGKRMNEDGTLPWARTKGLWDCLYERGVVRRSFNAKRFAWIRRFLNGAGLVEVQDPTYVIGERAAKWSPSERFWELASSLDDKEGEEEQDFTETGFVIDPQECWEKGVPLVPGRRHGKGNGGKEAHGRAGGGDRLSCNWNLAA